MRTVGITLLILCNVFELEAQQQPNKGIRGQVTEMSSGNKPLNQVQIKADFANATVSNNKGEFLLEFYKSPPGTAIKVKLIYKDWIVVNEKDLHTKIPNNLNTQKLKIYMCPDSIIDMNRVRYYSISEKFINTRYEKEIAAIKKERADFAITKKKLEDERDEFKVRAYELAERLARINFDDISDLQKLAFEQFNLGNVERAIEILESINSVGVIADAKKEKQKYTAIRDSANAVIESSNTVISQHMNKLQFQAELYSLQGKFKKAEQTYKDLVMADTTNFKNILALAEFLDSWGDPQEAVRFYEKGLSLNPTLSDQAHIHSSLAGIYTKYNNWMKGMDHHTDALNLYDSLAQNDEEFKINSIVSRSNLAILFRQMQQYDMAIRINKSCIEQYASLLDSNATNSEALEGLARVKFNLGSIYVHLFVDMTSLRFQDSTLLDTAQMLYLESAAIQKKTVSNNTVIHEATKKNADQIKEIKRTMDLASYYFQIGVFFYYYREDCYSDITKYLNSAKDIYSSLVANDSTKHISQMGELLNTMAVVHQKFSNTDEALATFNKALEIFLGFHVSYPELFQEDILMVHLNIGQLCKTAYENNRTMKKYLLVGAKHTEEALKILETFHSSPRNDEYVRFAQDQKKYFTSILEK